MKKLSTEYESLSAIDLTPMLDVVFIMLIFFIVTASFVKVTGVEVEKPLAQEARTQKNIKLLLAITDDNQLWMDKKRIDIRNIKLHLESLHAAYPNGALVVQADTFADINTLTKVVKIAKEIGVIHVSVAANNND